jgi:hypothetical protein
MSNQFIIIIIIIIICENCWVPNSQLVPVYLLAQPLGYYYKFITQSVLCILIPQMLKFQKKLHLKLPNLVFLNK